MDYNRIRIILQIRVFPMNIVIIGAGDIGLYMATVFSAEKENVFLVDIDGAKLVEAGKHLDIATREGSGSDWKLLDDLLEMKPDLFLAMTNNDEVNLVACDIAKQLGYPRTVCRVKDNRFLNRTRLDFARLFNVDYFICPELLVANEIYKSLICFNSLGFESFAHGALQMRTLKIPSRWIHENKTLKHLHLPAGLMIGLISREDSGKTEIIFPHGDDVLLPGDHVTFVGNRDSIASIPEFFGLIPFSIETVVILGGSIVGVHLARLLYKLNVDVRIIDKDPERCKELAKEVPFCRIIHHDGTDMEFLMTEKIAQAGYVIACTQHDEINVLTALVAKRAGCEHVGIVLSDNRFVPLANQLGFVQIVSPQAIAARHLLSLAKSQTVTSLVSLYDHQVEVLEISVSMNCKIIGVPLADAAQVLPKDLLIVMIQNRGRISIAKGDSIICPGDTVIVMCQPKTIPELSNLF